jgi:TolB-like protein
MRATVRSLVGILVTAAAVVPAAGPGASAQAGGVTIAVFRFGNAGAYGESRDTTEARRLRIGTMLARELAQQPGITTIAPRQTAAAVGPDSTGKRRGRRIDAATATRVARELGAQYAVTGSFVDHFGRLRVNAQLVDVRSGAIVKAFTNNDPALQRRENLPDIVSAQAIGIAKAVTGDQ